MTISPSRTWQERALFWACFLFYVRVSILAFPVGCGHEDLQSMAKSVGSLLLALLTVHLTVRYAPKFLAPFAAAFGALLLLSWLLTGTR